MDNLAHFYQQHFNLLNATFLRIDHSDTLVAIVYKIISAKSAPLIIKICPRPDDYARELYYLQYFSHILPVPRLIDVFSPIPGRYGAILMECLPGRLLQYNDFNESLAYEMGAVLARIHLHRVSGFGDLTQPNTLSPHPHIPFTIKFEEGVLECWDHLPKSIIKSCQHYFTKHVNLLSSVDGPCIIHRDFRPGNLLVDEGKLQGVIDWASGRASFAEEDFCSLEHGEWLKPSSCKKAFLAGYADIRPIPEYQRLIPLLRLSKAIATIGFTVKQGTWGGTNADLYRFNRQFLENFLGSLA